MRVLVTGATGFLGRPLVAALQARGDHVVVITRDASRAGPLGAVEVIAAELETPGAWQSEIAGCDAVVHLAGEPIGARRWNAQVKQMIRDSRVEGTRVLVEGIAQVAPERRPRILVHASGADFYSYATGPGEFADDEVTEKDPVGDHFLGSVCRNWEEEAARATDLGLRVVAMRTGLVLGDGGALARMTGPFKWFVGGPIGSGRQWVSWIHRDDAVAAYLAALDDDRYRGPINLVAGSVTAKDLARALGAALGRPSWLPVPAFAVRAAVGELAEYLLNGRNVIPARLKSLGFTFAHPEIEEALSSSRAPARTSARAG